MHAGRADDAAGVDVHAQAHHPNRAAPAVPEAAMEGASWPVGWTANPALWDSWRKLYVTAGRSPMGWLWEGLPETHH
eukprot:351675-Chlamydomonas_euryale.AAC.2